MFTPVLDQREKHLLGNTWNEKIHVRNMILSGDRMTDNRRIILVKHETFMALVKASALGFERRLTLLFN